MLSGSVSPKSVGLTDQKDVEELLSLSKKRFKLMDQNILTNPPTTIAFYMTGYVMQTSDWWHIAMIGIPYSLMATLWADHFWNVVGYQFVLFDILTRYFKIRIRQLDNKLAKLKDMYGYPKHTLLKSSYSKSNSSKFSYPKPNCQKNLT